MTGAAGYSLLELLVVIALIGIVTTAAVPLAVGDVDRARTAGAAAYLGSRLTMARFEAIKRSTFVGMQFVARPDGYWYRTYRDGNGNGISTRDISSGVDQPIGTEERLDQKFPGVSFGICPDTTGIDPGDQLGNDPVRIGQANLLSFNPNGSATSGTLYVRGAYRNQFAVRILGATARVRVLRFDFGKQSWR